MQVYRSQWNGRGLLHILAKDELNPGDLRIDNFVPREELLSEIDQHKQEVDSVIVRFETFDWKEVGELAIALRQRNLITTLT